MLVPAIYSALASPSSPLEALAVWPEAMALAASLPAASALAVTALSWRAAAVAILASSSAFSSAGDFSLRASRRACRGRRGERGLRGR